MNPYKSNKYIKFCNKSHISSMVYKLMLRSPCLRGITLTRESESCIYDVDLFFIDNTILVSRKILNENYELI